MSRREYERLINHALEAARCAHDTTTRSEWLAIADEWTRMAAQDDLETPGLDALVLALQELQADQRQNKT